MKQSIEGDKGSDKNKICNPSQHLKWLEYMYVIALYWYAYLFTRFFILFRCECKIIERLVKLEIARDEQSKTIEQLQEKSKTIEQLQEQIKTIDQLKEADKAKMAEIEKLNSEMKGLKKPTVMVKVRISKDLTLSVGQRLIYDVVVTNIGNAYKKASGSFRAPVEGNYLFSVTACSKTSDWGVLDIIHDGEVIGQVRSGDADAYNDCNSEVTVARMEAGSTIWVERRTGRSGIQNASHWNSFTAILIN